MNFREMFLAMKPSRKEQRFLDDDGIRKMCMTLFEDLKSIFKSDRGDAVLMRFGDPLLYSKSILQVLSETRREAEEELIGTGFRFIGFIVPGPMYLLLSLYLQNGLGDPFERVKPLKIEGFPVVGHYANKKVQLCFEEMNG